MEHEAKDDNADRPKVCVVLHCYLWEEALHHRTNLVSCDIARTPDHQIYLDSL